MDERAGREAAVPAKPLFRFRSVSDVIHSSISRETFSDICPHDSPPPKGGGAIPGTGERFAANLLTLGCEVIAIARNKCTDAVGDVKGEKYLIFPGIEAEGQPLEIRDARGNLVMQHIKNGQGER